MGFIIIAAILIAVGIFLIYFLDRVMKKEDWEMYVALGVGIVLILTGLYVAFYNIPIEILQKKLAGFIIGVIGFFLVFKAPDITDYQPSSFGGLSILIGLFLLIIGLYLFAF